jgi:4-hydroxy-2-oxoheptanedioate aldolase
LVQCSIEPPTDSRRLLGEQCIVWDMKPNKLKDMYAAKQTATGGWVGFSSPYVAEILGHTGFDAVVLDLQHGPFYLDAAVPMLQAISATNAVPLARCSGNNFAEINKLLDAGAYGIICPMIETVDDAKRFVAACRYPPLGTRSFGPTRGLLYGGADYFAHANTTILTYGMIETPQAMENLDAICAVEGLDGILIGPSDLSLALGAPPIPNHTAEPLKGAIAKIYAAARKHGKMTAIFCAQPNFAVDMKKMGFDFIAPGNDAGQLKTYATQLNDMIKNA